jgi:ligand-binding SRPBCC domain-containing protein
MPIITLETYIQAPAERCFDLSLNVDLHSSSMRHTQERAIAGVTSGMLRLHDTVTWEAVHFGIKQHLTSQITLLERPHRFIDEMMQGAFKELKHMHQFVPQENGTLMIDRLEFKSPLGCLGWIVDKLVLERYMRNLLLQRNQHIKQAAEGELR